MEVALRTCCWEKWALAKFLHAGVLVLRSPYLANLYTEQFFEIWHKAGGS